ncbi:hypothetical protein [Spelaeicoccus albus]|uniref:hypothetical protein n=1 Tax=Spelaeicoccus albus TaxID=1280376 RepID=UPI0015CCE119|nr:hypothetical protein [Spelaeicoccus albus]
MTIAVAVLGAIVAAPAILRFIVSGLDWASLDGIEKTTCIIMPLLLVLIILSAIFDRRQTASKNQLQHDALAAQEKADTYKKQLAHLRENNAASQRNAAEAIQNSLAAALEAPLKATLEELGVWSEQSRVSAYRHDAKMSAFVMISRISADPSLAKAGRGTYPDDIGLISAAWTLGQCDDDCNRTDSDAWAKYQARNADLPYGTGIGVMMKARSIRGIRVNDGDDMHPLGVLIFEHMDYQRFTHPQVLNALAGLSELPAYGCIQTAFKAVPPHTFHHTNGLTRADTAVSK